MRAIETPTLYLSYVETPGAEGVYVFLPDSAAAEEAADMGHRRVCRVSRLHTRSGRPGDPNIEIVCFSESRLGRERAEEISQGAINWLMEEGHLQYSE